MSDPYAVVKHFERALCDYTGARYAVTVTSCTAALMLAVAWHVRTGGHVTHIHELQLSVRTGNVLNAEGIETVGDLLQRSETELMKVPYMGRRSLNEIKRALDARGLSLGMVPYGMRIEIPRRTYLSVPMSIIHAGGRPVFRDEAWIGAYQLKPLPVWDCARRFTSGMFVPGQMQCVSFHWSKILGIQQGGAILHDNDEADAWLRRARFDGRTEGVAPKYDAIDMVGWHCYMSPEIAADGLIRLQFLKRHNPDLPNDEYPDLSAMEIFR